MAAKKKTSRQAEAPAAPPAPDVAPDAPPAAEPHRRGLPVVGIGASAGGLDAFKKFFAAMPVDSGIAFVLIPHLDPTHESMMVELIARHTGMPVVEADDKTKVEANHVYIIPPNKYMTISGGTLHLTGPVERRAVSTSIDMFLRSLADDLQERAICVILSGTGGHGTLGLRAVKANGGMAMVQDPQTAEYDRMPLSAVATGLADFILPPEQMPAALVKYVQHPYVKGRESTPVDAQATDHLQQILALLRTRTKYNFNCYRKKLLLRRIERRMGLGQIDSLPAYLQLLRTSPDEVRHLSRDLFISVTSFFRDPEAFQAVETQALPQLIAARLPDAPIRVWVPGCATGEEAYSLAIVLLEKLAEARRPNAVQVFATDVDAEALEVGRAGVYPDSIGTDVSLERLAKFFTRADDHHLRVNRVLRDSLVFAVQNLIADPPFSKVDLISCRNLLIYLEPEVQRKLIAVLHFALNENGFLILGPSETIGRQVDLFEPMNKKWRIYRRIGAMRPEHVEFPIAPQAEGGDEPRPGEAAGRERTPNFAQMTQSLLLASYAPAAVLINRRHEILYFFGPTTLYLEHPTGEPTQDLMLLVRDDLRTKLRAMIHRVVRDNKPAVEHGVRAKRDGGRAVVTLTVQPVVGPRIPDGLLLVTFEDEREAPPAAAAKPDDADDSHIQELELDLKTTREDLQSTIEELESSNEELKAANEEVMSMNEELQSANEELETSKEELQSLNEELSTVNSQLQNKVEELEATTNDLTNVLNSGDIAILFIDPQLKIRWFTPCTTKLLNLISTDVGRPFQDIRQKFADDTLVADVDQVRRTLAPLEKEVRSDDGLWYIRRVAPYRTVGNRIDGVVLSFVDVTAVKQAGDFMRRLATVLFDSSDAVIVYDFDGRIQSWNRSAERTYGYSEAQALAMNVTALVPEDRRPEYQNLVRRVRRGETVPPLETKRVRSDGAVLDVALTVSAIKNDAGKPVAVTSTARDITEQKKAEREMLLLNSRLEERVAQRTAELKKTNSSLYEEVARRRQAQEAAQRLAAIVESSADAIVSNTIDGNVTSWNAGAEQIYGYTAQEMIGRSIDRLVPPDAQAELKAIQERVRRGDQIEHMEVRRLHKDGREIIVSLVNSPIRNEAGEVIGTSAIARDITRQKQLEHAVRQSEARLAAVVGSAGEGLVTIDDRGIIQSFNETAERLFGYAAKEVIGNNVNMLMPSPYHDAHDDYLKNYLTTGVKKIIGIGREVVARRKDGSSFPIDLSVSEFQHGAKRQFVGLIRDISQRKLLEKEVLEIASAEQRRIGQDLHDSVGQELTGLGLVAETLADALVAQAHPEATLADKIAAGSRRILGQVRALSRGLIPVEVDATGLPSALAELATRVQETSQVACKFRHDPSFRWSDNVAATHFYRIAQEAVSNALKHGRPRAIDIYLGSEDGRVSLRVWNDGVPIPLADAADEGMGLKIMRYRAGLIDAILSIEPSDRGGTVVECTSIRGSDHDQD